MRKKKQEKAVRRIENAVRKAVEKGVPENAVERAVTAGIEKSARNEPSRDKKEPAKSLNKNRTAEHEQRSSPPKKAAARSVDARSAKAKT